MDDLISRQAAIDICHKNYDGILDFRSDGWTVASSFEDIINSVPSVQPEPLTDKEQRIFLAAMGREEKVCEEVDRNHIREPYEDSLMWICREIKRKVKGALWT